MRPPATCPALPRWPRWQRAQLPDAIRDLVLDDQRLRNALCWNVFDCQVADRC
jgi:hypothetical protein